MNKLLMLLCLYGMAQVKTASAQRNFPFMLDWYMRAQDSVNEFNGAVLVAARGKMIYQKSFGFADREWKQPNNQDTKFEICSLTKQFTAAAILQLSEQHKLSLEDRLSKYFPDYPNADKVTLHMLLNHTSGIVDYTSLPGFETMHKQPLTKDSVISLFKNQPFTFSPGSRWNYSNSNYFLLGYIVEKVSGLPYDVYVNKNLFEKAGLRNTSVNHADSILAYRARGYSQSETGSWKNAESFAMELEYSAGAIISTASDLYLWQKELVAGKIISSETLVKMTTPYLENYGYGLRIDTLENHRRISHGGAVPGFTSFLGYFPDDDITIVVLSNNFANSSPIADALANILFGLPVETPHKIMERSINVAVLLRYPGNYQIMQSSGTTNFELVTDSGKLFLKPNPQSDFKMELKPESETRFFFVQNHDQEIEFFLDANNRIIKCNLISKGTRMEIKKMK